ncbi:MAG TPA: acyl-CoA dehydrogenase family protein [Vicinamibacterales bacterium]|nr:acyl-CoA dehydrogenase family protein [Vicinamibacterales bacterium]
MADRSFLDWPFFDDAHRTLHRDVASWRDRSLRLEDEADPFSACRAYVAQLGAAGWTTYATPAGAGSSIDLRSICLIRETLAYASGLAEFAFAMQGLGAGPISLFGSEALKRRYLPDVAAGRSIAAFAISEADAGSDLSAMKTTARRDGDAIVIDGEKTWISNAGIASHYVVFCRWPEGGDRAFTAVVVDAGTPGLQVSRTIQVIAPHPLGTIAFTTCRVPIEQIVGEPGKGMGVALGTLDLFRTTVGAAALGFARRAFDDAVRHVKARVQFGKPLAEFQLTQARLADMAAAIDAAALLVYRAAWTRDRGAPRITREAAMAKLVATEAAQQVIDAALQLFGGRGVVHGEAVERLYREIRALRIYEGTSEIQKLVIAGQVLRD